MCFGCVCVYLFMCGVKVQGVKGVRMRGYECRVIDASVRVQV